MQLRLTLSHSIAACTAAARLRLGGVAPRLLRSLCIRGWAVRGSDAQRRGSYCVPAARHRRAAWRPISCSRSPRKGGVARCFDLALPSHVVAARTSAVRVGGVAPRLSPSLYRRRWPARGSDLRSRTASRLARLRRVCGWSA